MSLEIKIGTQVVRGGVCVTLHKRLKVEADTKIEHIVSWVVAEIAATRKKIKKAETLVGREAAL